MIILKLILAFFRKLYEAGFCVAPPISKRGRKLLAQNPGLGERIINELHLGDKDFIEATLDGKKVRLWRK